MEITPGEGTPFVRLGENRAEVEARLGEPERRHGGRAFHESLTPVHIVDYGESETVELVEIPYGDAPEQEVTLDGVQLTHRLLHEVRDELVAAGHTCRASDIGFEFADGFTVFSMGSLDPAELPDGVTADDEEARVVEGVGIARPDYFGF